MIPFDQFVSNALLVITEIITIKAKGVLSTYDLADILSDFPQNDELFQLPSFHEKLGLTVTTLILLFEMHSHLTHPETILD